MLTTKTIPTTTLAPKIERYRQCYPKNLRKADMKFKRLAEGLTLASMTMTMVAASASPWISAKGSEKEIKLATNHNHNHNHNINYAYNNSCGRSGMCGMMS